MEARNGGVRRIGRRLTFATTAVTLVTTTLVGLPATPAAAEVYVLEEPVSWAYTDSAHPRTSYVDRDAPLPVGAWRDDRGGRHKSRAYFTFDLGNYAGRQILSVTGILRESAVNDCTKPNAMEVWRTDLSTSPTWRQAPRERAEAGDVFPSPACPANYLELDMTDLVRQAVVGGDQRATFVVRVPDSVEGNVAYGRRIVDLRMSVVYNTPPRKPTEPRIDQRACSPSELTYVRTTQPELQADVADDEEGEPLTAVFAIWPVDNPDRRTEVPQSGLTSGATAGITVPDGVIAPDVVYAWSVQTKDSDSESPWTDPCRFTLDLVAPANPPQVSSTDYPEVDTGPGFGGVGVPGEFTFSASGDPDVVEFFYVVNELGKRVPADAPGGSATVTITPRHDGTLAVRVRGVDRAGNMSPPREYRTQVRDTAPTIHDGNQDGALGEPRTITFRPGTADVVEYLYTVNHGDEQRVAADADGVATITLRPAGGFTYLTIRSRTSQGWLSEPVTYSFHIASVPVVSSAEYPEGGDGGGGPGIPGTFAFTATQPGAVEFVYQFNDEPFRTVAATPDGTATITWAPSASGHGQTLTVRSRHAGGLESEHRTYSFAVLSDAPQAASTDYPQWLLSGAPGVPGTFTFTAKQRDAATFVYAFNDEAEHTVVVGADGTASIAWAPTSSGWQYLRVRSRTASGVASEGTEYAFQVRTNAPEIASADYPQDGQPHVGIGVTGTFTFTAKQAGVTEFVYTFQDEPARTVAARPDGSATVSWAPSQLGWTTLTVHSKNSAGVESDKGVHTFLVRSDMPDVASDDYPAGGWGGGPGVPGTFRFTAYKANTVEFVYSFNEGPERTVPSRPDATAEITWTPTTENFVELLVYSRSVDGTTSQPRYYTFFVNQ